MNRNVAAWWGRLKAWWEPKSLTQKLKLGGVAALALALLAVGGRILWGPHWTPLYTNLSPAVAGQITAQLTQMKVPYELTDGGRTILVPAKDVDQARVTLADHNVPQSGTVGLPALNSFTLGETDQELALSQLLATEQELAQTIDSIRGVHASRVLINEPPPSLFGESGNPPTASVFVDLNPGAALSNGQVQGIMNLVAHAVPGLKPDQVSVVDQYGTLLSARAGLSGPAAALAGLSGSELKATEATDAAIASQVQSMLNQVLGPGQAVVRVQAQLNFASGTQTSTTYGTGVVSRTSVSKQTSTSQGGTVIPAGATGNTPTYPAAGTTGPSSSSSSTTTTQYLVPSTRTTTSTPAGSISRLTVAVAVNRRLSPAQVRNLTSLVSQAAGLNPARGDKVTVMGLPFNQTALKQALAAMHAAQVARRDRRYAEAGAAVLAALGLLLWVRSLSRRWGGRLALKANPPAALAGAGGEGALSPASVAALLKTLEKPAPATPADAARQQISEWAARDPEAVARVLRAWVSEDER
ncbi:Flagellar M-ring protein [Candidatus Hydrogenisulfobacillus filiaventi]|uniref:Flagellar M-ring protein n=1 Tax=Candidatus Hydrogenisulfobacillus filiaventi TaxID=2707344 RepID=A0A6F8ZEI2_9FIRM|nr:flagellar basal-body MS-ring/collar protein FliF [Bacillota bacterium]CAB1128009.1 Flagellar M-ring protein [Candidatus Hydrogenisulfobacillus filiaventi]